MASNINNNLSGKVNIPTKVVTYTGLSTDTADVIVDNVNKTIAVDVDLADIASRFITQSELDGEISSREAADASLENDIDVLGTLLENETLTRRSADEYVQKELQKEIARATSAEDGIENELFRVTDAVRQELNEEVIRAEEAEAGLHSEISDENARAVEAEEHLQSAINEEAIRATEAEDLLQSKLNTEKEDRHAECQAISVDLENHRNDYNNPHLVTKAQVGLGSVVNTADSAFPEYNGTEKFTTGGAYNLKADLEQAIANEANARDEAIAVETLAREQDVDGEEQRAKEAERLLQDHIDATNGALETLDNSLADVAKSGKYSDLLNIPEMPLILHVSNITELSNDECEALKCGDVIVKETGEQEHSYRVSYKEDGVGMCLTYSDASNVETVSYDFDGTDWVYNSTDITPIPTKTSELTNDSGFVTGEVDLTEGSESVTIDNTTVNVVTTDTDQTITGDKEIRSKINLLAENSQQSFPNGLSIYGSGYNIATIEGLQGGPMTLDFVSGKDTNNQREMQFGFDPTNGPKINYTDEQDSSKNTYIRMPLGKGSIISYETLAIDSEVVHKTGNETILGNKTFGSYNQGEATTLTIYANPASTDVFDSTGLHLGNPNNRRPIDVSTLTACAEDTGLGHYKAQYKQGEIDYYNRYYFEGQTIIDQYILNFPANKSGTIALDEEVVHRTIECADITALTTAQCNSLAAGDVVIKVTGNQKHSYRVSYKENNQGLCLTYTDASVSETVSYDFDGTDWIYNSTDVIHNVENTNVENGTVVGALQEARDVNAVVFYDDSDPNNIIDRNPNARALDPTIATTIDTGATNFFNLQNEGYNVALNGNTMAVAKRSLANGNKTIAKGEESHAEGYQSVSLGHGSHAEGAQTVSKGLQSHSEGVLTQALGDGSHAEGHSTIAGGLASHTEGSGNKVGTFTQEPGIGADQTSSGGGQPQPPLPPYAATDGEGSHAEGYNNILTKYGSHAEGLRNYITSSYAHIEGVNNTSSGEYSHTEGYNNINSGECSLVSGVWNNNTAYGAFVTGFHNTNTKHYKFVTGCYNENQDDTLLEVGNGYYDSVDDIDVLQNALEVYRDGTVKAQTKLSVGNVEITNGKLKIGTTEITEAQLQALLALLDVMEAE